MWVISALRSRLILIVLEQYTDCKKENYDGLGFTENDMIKFHLARVLKMCVCEYMCVFYTYVYKVNTLYI